MSQQEAIHTPWVFNKEISIANVVSTIALVIAGFVYVSALDKEIKLNAQSIAYMTAQRKEDTVRIAHSIDNMNKKLDTLIAHIYNSK
ncbi:MAG TPA: hypothetical protein EYN67_13350 [Flavobacteriales bacterium]|nr:hypothetical protein [Methylococcaceae bacterium]HHZ96503.1 hypothetical protein [Flavobacteriales bacterium]